MSMDVSWCYFYVKCARLQYMTSKCSYKKHICLLLNKSRYEHSATYEVNKWYTNGIVPLYDIEPKFTGT